MRSLIRQKKESQHLRSHTFVPRSCVPVSTKNRPRKNLERFHQGHEEGRREYENEVPNPLQCTIL